jgi:hypothetical protein
MALIIEGLLSEAQVANARLLARLLNGCRWYLPYGDQAIVLVANGLETILGA